MHPITPPKHKRHYLNLPSASKDALNLKEDDHNDAKKQSRIISESAGLTGVCLLPDVCII